MTEFKKKLLMEVGIGGGVIVALAAALAFTGSYLGNASTQIAAARTELLERSAAVGSLASLRETWRARAEGSLNVLKNVVPEKDTLINVSRDFQSLASQTRTEYSFGFVGETEHAGEGLGALGFRLTLRGDLLNLYAFVEKFGAFPYLSTIDNFTIEREGPGMRSELAANGRIFFR